MSIMSLEVMKIYMCKQIHTCEWGWMGGKVDEERENFIPEESISDFNKFTNFLFKKVILLSSK